MTGSQQSKDPEFSHEEIPDRHTPQHLSPDTDESCCEPSPPHAQKVHRLNPVSRWLSGIGVGRSHSATNGVKESSQAMIDDDSCCEPETTTVITGTEPRLALLGSPNAGKTSVFNALTGLRARTGNYPGVTVGRKLGIVKLDESRGVDANYQGPKQLVIEDLPGTYSLEAISPDEQVVVDVLEGTLDGYKRPDGLLIVIDSTTLRRSLTLFSEAMAMDLPTMVILTMSDEMEKRGGHLDTLALEKALGVPVLSVVGTKPSTFASAPGILSERSTWPRPPINPPTLPAEEHDAWVDSVLSRSGYIAPHNDRLTRRIDSVLLHPFFGTLFFFAVMFAFFQIIFVLAAPFQEAIEDFFSWLGTLSSENISNPILSDFIASAMLGGVGTVLTFVPQIALMFLLISLMESIGYMSRAAFLMDTVMSRAGLEGRSFVAMLSSFACAVPGIMATRTIPSPKDRIATIITAPLMTCSARLPVFIMLIGLVVSNDSTLGPFSAQGVALFGLYILGGLSALTASAIFKKTILRSGTFPFYMEMPPYRMPTLKAVLKQMWDSVAVFVRKVGKIILTASIVLWVLLSLPANFAMVDQISEETIASVAASNQKAVEANKKIEAENRRLGQNRPPVEIISDEDAQAMADAKSGQYVKENSYAARVGKFMEPVFAPLGFDWRINIAIMGSMTAREVFVSTLGQVAAAEDPDNPDNALEEMTYTSGAHEGEKLFSPPTTVAMMIFFVYALQCMSTVGAIRRETNGWKWPAFAWTYMFILAWVGAWIARLITIALTG